MSELVLSPAAFVEAQAEHEARKFLLHEAELLDYQQFDIWFALLSKKLVYRVPVRTTRASRDDRGFSKTAFFLEEDYASMKARIVRVASAWVEDSKTRTRRMVSNIRVRSASAGAISCASNLAIYSYRDNVGSPFLLTGEREDELEKVDGKWNLARRVVLLDAAVLDLELFSIFL